MPLPCRALCTSLKAPVLRLRLIERHAGFALKTERDIDLQLDEALRDARTGRTELQVCFESACMERSRGRALC